jgi:hypothetical protein
MNLYTAKKINIVLGLCLLVSVLMSYKIPLIAFGYLHSISFLGLLSFSLTIIIYPLWIFIGIGLIKNNKYYFPVLLISTILSIFTSQIFYMPFVGFLIERPITPQDGIKHMYYLWGVNICFVFLSYLTYRSIIIRQRNITKI